MADGGRIPTGFADFNGYMIATYNWLNTTPPGAAQANWERLTLSGSQINLWNSYNNTWVTLYAKFVNPDLKTKGVKDNMLALVSDFKIFAQPILRHISGWYSATTDDFETFHIKEGILRDTDNTGVDIPVTHPVITFIDINEPLKHTLHIKDELAEGIGRPKGVIACEIAYIVRDSENPPDSVEDCTLGIIGHSSLVEINFPVGSSEKRAYYFLRWLNTTAEHGGWSGMYHALIS